MLLQQKKQVIDHSQDVRELERKVEQMEMDKNNSLLEIEKLQQIIHLYNAELEGQRTHTSMLEGQVQALQNQVSSLQGGESEMFGRIEEVMQSNRALENELRQKDQELFKYRQDNQMMYQDLKALSESEDIMKNQLS